MEFWEELQPGLQPPGCILHPRDLPCIHRIGIRLQRLLRIALFLDPVQLKEGATRDISPQYQTENLTLHGMCVCEEMMEFWSCGTYSQ